MFVCMCHAQTCAWDCAFSGPGPQGSGASPSLPILSPPKCLGCSSRWSQAGCGLPGSWVPGAEGSDWALVQRSGRLDPSGPLSHVA